MAFTLEDPRAGGFGSSQSDGPRGSRGTDLGAEAADDQRPSRVLKESPWSSGPSPSDSPFAVDEDYQRVLSDEPAWQTRYDMSYDMPTVMLSGDGDLSSSSSSYRTSAGRRARADDADADGDREVGAEAVDEEGTGARAARAAWNIPGLAMAARKDLQWHCESPLRWVDLGPDYFPRYLRSADCANSACTGAGFVCRPRSFSVKVLRRREGVCAPAGDLPVEESTVGLPSDLRDLWVWELRAVNFCCVCSLR
ncbi:hypothetical protein ONE63_002463 [Megalurothrips usitatus]|uniref:Protein trunk n=1 Tax=Megalurothrips usitatus TaxID=439358 RepID=A0AAV7XBS9_9NEOP|nr:hypothetical protein ONE63_002463 [Megalurothrips usitatus]